MRIPAKAYRNRVNRAVLHLLLPAKPTTGLVRLGSDWGGWWVPESALRPGAIVYSAGVGGDISFDLAVIERGCQVWGFDPTPFVIRWIEEQDTPDGWHFVPVGLSDRAATLRFYAPAYSPEGSHSTTTIGDPSTYFDAPVDSLPALMARLGHDYIDLLKMDIEGAEADVLEHMIRDQIFPPVVCVEIDKAEPAWTTARRVRRLARSGDYTIIKVDFWNVTLARR
jgi:FkbM family methyltransferase